MTELEWLTLTDPLVLLQSLEGRASDRKLRLFACACCRRLGAGEAMALGEGYADGLVSALDLAVLRAAARRGGRIHYKTWRLHVSRQAAWVVEEATRLQAWDAAVGTLSHGAGRFRGFQCDLLRELFGNPFHPVTVSPHWLAWEEGLVPGLAQAIYEEGAFERLPILADALEDAGCREESILVHCRQEGRHVRGCWVLDRLLGKE
jgi:hypothetical protein